jgi:hypothetical protein
MMLVSCFKVLENMLFSGERLEVEGLGDSNHECLERYWRDLTNRWYIVRSAVRSLSSSSSGVDD